jgi:8-oxo-dGTP diphosphatase
MTKRIEVSKILVQNSKGKFLVVQKSEDYDWKAGKWELPGGKISENEDRFGAGKRELEAETGLDAHDLREVVRVEVEEFSGEKPVVNCWILYTESFSGEIELSEEHQDYRWVTSEEFMKLDWHRDAGYEIPAVKNIEKYLK